MGLGEGRGGRRRGGHRAHRHHHHHHHHHHHRNNRRHHNHRRGFGIGRRRANVASGVVPVGVAAGVPAQASPQNGRTGVFVFIIVFWFILCITGIVVGALFSWVVIAVAVVGIIFGICGFAFCIMRSCCGQSRSDGPVPVNVEAGSAATANTSGYGGVTINPTSTTYIVETNPSGAGNVSNATGQSGMVAFTGQTGMVTYTTQPYVTSGASAQDRFVDPPLSSMTMAPYPAVPGSSVYPPNFPASGVYPPDPLASAHDASGLGDASAPPYPAGEFQDAPVEAMGATEPPPPSYETVMSERQLQDDI